MDRKRSRIGGLTPFFIACVIMAPILICGCGHLYEGFPVRPAFKDANDLFSQGRYRASLIRYELIMKKYPDLGDRALFEMGIIYAYPDNGQKDYQKSLQCFQKLIRDYPQSVYRQDSLMMIFHLNTMNANDEKLGAQQKLIENLQQEIAAKGLQIVAQQKKIEALDKKIFDIQSTPADKILIEKKERRMRLMANGKVIRTYKIALGGNPTGPKERQGDNKTPEGIYTINARNGDSRYHLSLHISYPNEKDKKRAKRLGVSPGGDIMIHGIKNGYSWVGNSHTAYDWTNGCIAVTDEEMEEIYRLVPIGTMVEIKP